MELWDRLRGLELGWTGLATLTGAFLLVLFLRRQLPEARRHRGRLSVLLLGLGPILHFVATGLRLLGAHGASGALHLVNLFLIVMGIAGAASLVLFDIVLGRSTIPTIVRDMTQALMFGLFVFIVLKSGGFEPLSVVTTSAVATAVIGLALQNVIANLFAGLLLQFERTFRLGDWIQIGSRIGQVTEIHWRSSSMLTRDGDVAAIPNMQFLSQEVVNLSRPTRGRRVAVRVPFHRRHSPGEVEAAALEAVSSVGGVGSEPPPACSPVDFGPGSNVMYAIKFWVNDVADEGRIEAEVRRRLWYSSERRGLEGPCSRSRKKRELEGEALARRLRSLERVGVFAPLEAAERESVAAAMRRARFTSGEVILREAEPGDSLFIVESGEVRVEASSAKKPIATLGAGACFGEMSLLTGEARKATCTAIGETVAYEIDFAAMRALLQGRPALADQITDLLSAREMELAGSRRSSELAPDVVAERRTKMFKRVRDYFHLG